MTAPPDTLADLVCLVYRPYGETWADGLRFQVEYAVHVGEPPILRCRPNQNGAYLRFEVLWSTGETTMPIYRAVNESTEDP